MYLIDYGNDFNKDKHCDLDGWFVDKEGFHIPRSLSSDDRRSIYLKKPNYYSFSIPNHYRTYGFNNLIDVTCLKEYSENDPNNKFSSPTINGQLRNGVVDSEVRNRIFQIDRLMDSFVFNKTVRVFRGMSVNFEEKHCSRYAQLQIGDVITEKSFTSTSYSFERACFYATKEIKNITIIFDIDLQPGVRGIPLFVKNGSAGSGFEHEIILERNLTFKIVEKKYTFEDKIGTTFIVYKMRTV